MGLPDFFMYGPCAISGSPFFFLMLAICNSKAHMRIAHIRLLALFRI